MSQNAMHMSWSAQEVDDKLHQIMYGIHEQCVKYGTESDGYINYVKGCLLYTSVLRLTYLQVISV